MVRGVTNAMKGKLFVIEGTDGSGKGTQTKLLVKKLEHLGYDVATQDFPRYGKKSAGLVEEYLNGRYGTAVEVGPYRASIFYACDRYAASFDIKEWLDEGKIVILNRYVSSNMGHQACKIEDETERAKYLQWLDELEFGLFGIPRPTTVFFLYVPAEIGQQLVEKKGLRQYIEGTQSKDIHEADLTHLKAAEATYKSIAKEYGWKQIDCVVDGKLRSIEEIHEAILQEVLHEAKRS